MDAPLQLKESLADRYDIKREIGAGGMATVYLAAARLKRGAYLEKFWPGEPNGRASDIWPQKPSSHELGEPPSSPRPVSSDV